MAQLKRCIAGHVYDPVQHENCPQCGPPQPKEPAPSLTEGRGDDHTIAISISPLSIAVAGGVVAVAALLWLVFAASPHGAGGPSGEAAAVVEGKGSSDKRGLGPEGEGGGKEAAKDGEKEPAGPKGGSPGSEEPARKEEANVWKDCRGDGKAPDIEGCTAIIEAGREGPEKMAVAYHNRGYASHRLNEIDNAMADYKAAIEAKPDYADPKRKLALLAVSKGEYKLALPFFDELVKARPGDAELHYDRAGAYFGMNEFERAISDYDEAIRIKPEHSLAYNNRAFAHFKLQKLDEALADADKAIGLDARNAYAYDTRGHVYEAMGKRDEAIADFKRALEIQPQLKESRDALARLGAAR